MADIDLMGALAASVERAREERSLSDELAAEAARVELRGRARLAASGSKHDPEL